MRNHRLNLGFSSLLTVVLVLLALTPQAAAGQRQRQMERLLILPALPGDPADSLYVLELADEMRSRLEGRFRTQVTIVSTTQYCEALEASGFDCAFIPDDNSALQLANFLRADSYTTSTFLRNSEPTIRLRMVDIGRSGIAGWVTVRGMADLSAKDFARVVADSLRKQVQVASNARGCSERRDRADYRGGRERAERVFRVYPNHPAAARCVADIFQATNQPPDSLIWAYQKMTTGDPLLERAWQRLAEAYFEKGDTLGAIESSEKRLSAVPDDLSLRLGVIQMWQLRQDYDRALPLVEEGLQRDPDNPDLKRLRARLCFDGQNWPCAVEAFGEWYEAEVNLASDSGFFIQILGAAEFADDSTALLRWSEEAVTQFPNSLQFWGRRAGLLAMTADTAATLEAFKRVMELNPGEYRSILSYASRLAGTVTIDTAVPLDTATLVTADSLMTVVAEMAGDDPNTQRLLAAFYYRPGSTLAQKQMRPDLAMSWLEKAIGYDVVGTVTGPASFFYGLAAFFHLQPWYSEVAASESCELAREFDHFAKLAVERMIAGASLAQSTADQLLPGLGQISDGGSQMVERFCASQ